MYNTFYFCEVCSKSNMGQQRVFVLLRKTQNPLTLTIECFLMNKPIGQKQISSYILVQVAAEVLSLLINFTYGVIKKYSVLIPRPPK